MTNYPLNYSQQRNNDYVQRGGRRSSASLPCKGPPIPWNLPYKVMASLPEKWAGKRAGKGGGDEAGGGVSFEY